jgi:hypothetical protein
MPVQQIRGSIQTWTWSALMQLRVYHTRQGIGQTLFSADLSGLCVISLAKTPLSPAMSKPSMSPSAEQPLNNHILTSCTHAPVYLHPYILSSALKHVHMCTHCTLLFQKQQYCPLRLSAAHNGLLNTSDICTRIKYQPVSKICCIRIL